MIASVTIRILAWPMPAMASPRRALEPGPTISVGCGNGSKRVTRRAPRITAPMPEWRMAGLRKSFRFKSGLLLAGSSGVADLGERGADVDRTGPDSL